MGFPEVVCEAPHCGRVLGDDMVLLDAPDIPGLTFCDLKCLWIWASHHAQTSFRELNSQWVDRKKGS